MTGLGDHKVVHVSAGSLHSAAVTEDGALYTWGKGNYGRLGHGEKIEEREFQIMKSWFSSNVVTFSVCLSINTY